MKPTTSANVPPTARSRGARLGWLAVGLLCVGLLGPAWSDPRRLAPGPYGGVDALLQAGLLEWNARHWWQPAVWPHLPIFHPARDVIAAMDSLLGQSLAVLPWRSLLPTVAARYNAALLSSLALAAVAMAWLWRASGGARAAAPLAALALLGAPMTLAHLGHLNQLPPPGIPAAAAALAWAASLHRSGRSPRRAWWALAAALSGQAFWGWYGFAEALLLVICLVAAGMIPCGGERGGRRRLLRGVAWPALAGALVVALAAWPYLRVAAQESTYERTLSEIRWYSADFKHLVNTGAHRAGPADWLGRGSDATTREARTPRQVLHPGWLALALAAWGWRCRRELAPAQRRLGFGLLLAGVCGLVLAFGDSVGLPGTDRRLPLPLGWLHAVFPPARAFRAAWRFGQLATIAAAWWAAAGWSMLPGQRGGAPRWRRLLPAAIVLALLVESWPARVPAVAIPDAGRPPAGVREGAVLTLPAPPDVHAEDAREAAWLLRALDTGRAVTGGASGWVPPVTAALRGDLAACERGEMDPGPLLARLRAGGVTSAEMRAGDPDPRLVFWREALGAAGAEARPPSAGDGFETWDWP